MKICVARVALVTLLASVLTMPTVAALTLIVQ